MDNLLNIIEDNKQQLPDGMYLNLLNELKKMYDTSETYTFLVRQYGIRPINKKTEDNFYMSFEEVLLGSKILKINKYKYDLTDYLPLQETKLKDEHFEIEIMLNSYFSNHEEIFEDFQTEEEICYIPYVTYYTLSLVQ